MDVIAKLQKEKSKLQHANRRYETAMLQQLPEEAIDKLRLEVQQLKNNCFLWQIAADLSKAPSVAIATCCVIAI
jgi:hypothetical protein